MKAQRLVLLGLIVLAATALFTMLVGRYSADLSTVLQIFKLHFYTILPIPSLVSADIVILVGASAPSADGGYGGWRRYQHREPFCKGYFVIPGIA